MIDVIVVGYPKSGNTWVTRLVAEMINCPVIGFWGSKHDEIAREGLDRKSNYQCFKAHHQYDELMDKGSNEKKLIYVLRDPRDVCISGEKYFKFTQSPALRLINKLPRGEKLSKKLDNAFNLQHRHQISEMSQAIINGNSNVHHWVRIPWAFHYKQYLDKDCAFVKYEDLLENPLVECQKIATFLGLEVSDEVINSAIDAQSFQSKKKAFLKAGDKRRANFMKSGTKEQWRNKLSGMQKRRLSTALRQELASLGYPVK